VGAAIGLFFADESWLGGYGSWKRRMLRLGHISLIGTGLLNLAFALSLQRLTVRPALGIASALFILGTVSMPAVCFLSAWRSRLRHLFFVPVASLVGATLLVVSRGLGS